MQFEGIVFAAALVVVAPTSGRATESAGAQNSLDATFVATLDGFQEVPSLSTPATGTFRARRAGDGSAVRIEYELSFSDIATTPTAAHIHFAQPGVNGAVSAFLCGGGDKPSCPSQGSLTGTIDAPDVVGPEARGIASGEIEELLRAMEAGFTYANVHSTQYPDGELRGQIEAREGGQ